MIICLQYVDQDFFIVNDNGVGFIINARESFTLLSSSINILGLSSPLDLYHFHRWSRHKENFQLWSLPWSLNTCTLYIYDFSLYTSLKKNVLLPKLNAFLKSTIATYRVLFIMICFCIQPRRINMLSWV